MTHLFKDSLSIVLAGEAGQGIQAIETILSALLKRQGYHVFATSEFMSRVRGGVNSVEILVSSQAAPAFVERIDILIPLTAAAISHLQSRISPQTLIIGDKSQADIPGLIDIPFGQLAAAAGSAIMANTVAAGLLSAVLGIGTEEGGQFLNSYFAKKDDGVRARNREAFAKGHAAGSSLAASVRVEIQRDPAVQEAIMLTGNEAITFGAIAGGVNYACAYPMSPGTTVLELLAKHSREFDILVEQVEDEIGVINMALGAWYAGARALVTTAGGGFALMVEGVSLSGIAEIPLVVHIAQRPGPATGLPTRTEQGDLFLAAFAGHGEFARLVLAPGNLQEAYALALAAFEFADRFQVPVFLLTDQYLLDSYHDTAPFNTAAVRLWIEQLMAGAGLASRNMEAAVAATPNRGGIGHAHRTGTGPGAIATAYDAMLAGPGFDSAPRDPLSGSWIIPSTPEYRRSRRTADGLSPRAIPGYGSGVTTVDSDEHDETGHITEDLRLRIDMVHKREAKTELLRGAIPLPEWIGPADAQTAIIGWGSTKQVIAQAIKSIDPETQRLAGGMAQIHFSWLNPFPEGLAEFLGRAKRLILVENNESGQLGRLLRMETGIHLPNPILRYDGLPFATESLAAELQRRLKGN